MIKKLLLPLVALLLTPLSHASAAAAPLRDGDIIFQTSRSAQSLAIQMATHSPYSHVGVVFYRAGQPYVFEAIQTVQYTPLHSWTARGEGGHYVVKRLRDAGRILTPAALARLRQTAATLQGKPYDLTFEWSDTRIYCSELVWKLYARALDLQIGRLQELRDFDLADPLVKAKMRERYGSAIPLVEPVISPGEMFASDALVLVAEE